MLLISTDPAHSLSDVFQKKLSGLPVRVKVGAQRSITVWEMNSAKLFADFMRRNRQEILRIAEAGSLFTAEEIAPLLDTALPGMSEMAGLLAILDAIESGKYSSVVVDTAPFGHTLRLFSLPAQFSKLLNFLELSASRDLVLAEHFGGRGLLHCSKFVEQWRLKLEKLQHAFASAGLFLVTTPENFALQESLRCIAELWESNSIAPALVVLNRTIKNGGRCPHCQARARKAANAVAFLRKNFKKAELYVAEDPGYPIMGIRMLRKFGEHVFGKREMPRFSATRAPRRAANIRPREVEWPPLNAPLTFVLGKGGVGKTTVSAGLGFHARQVSRSEVRICSVDPAPSLGDVFRTRVGERLKPVLGDQGLQASELDARSLFRTWVAGIRDEIRATTSAEISGVHVDLAFERRLFSELLEIVPPGLDEVMAIFRIAEMRDSPKARIVIDMAPTGHALELLRMPERILVWTRLLLKSLAAHRKLALARNAAVKVAELEVRARELSNALKSPSQAEAFAVMLPEPLPDRETERLLEQLRSLGIVCRRIFVNRVIFPASARNCLRCRLAEDWQRSTLAKLQRKSPGTDIYVVRDFGFEIAGKAGLRSLTRELCLLE